MAKQESVEVVRAIYDAYNRGDADGIVEVTDPEICIEDHGVIDGASYRGRSGVLEFLAFQSESFREQHVELEELVGVGGALLAVIHLSAEGSASGAPVGGRFAHVWELEEGLIRRLGIYSNKEEALEAVGLRE
ncbi:MAG: nuclear transport factor 2 family protein [Solirubrobacteraceae bacterium]